MQQITVSVGGYAAADPNALATSQLQDAGAPFVLDGVNGTADNNSIAAAQTLGAAGNFTLTSTQVSLNPPQPVYLTTTDDETSVNFTVYGFDINYAAVVEQVAGVDTSVVSTVKKFAIVTRVAADAATTGNVSVGAYSAAVLSPAGRVTITPAGNESTNNFTITGTNWNGDTISEVLAGQNATASTSVLDYKTVTSVVPENATAAAVEVGTAQSGGSRWMRLDSWANAQVGVQVNVSGTIDYSVEQTFDDPNSPTNPIAAADVTWLAGPADITTESTAKVSAFAYAPTFLRIISNSGNGTATLTAVQYNAVVK